MTEGIEAQVEKFSEEINKIKEEMAKVIVGQEQVIDDVLRTILAGGHILVEGVPGLGKTLIVRTLGQIFSLDFSRIQFTPDLMPADIIGTNIIIESETGHKSFTFQKGPIFSQIILADEVNRATPKTQSALLEAMQEHSVTVHRDTYQLTEPFVVMATQNPIEMEGTYPLPEAQLDRFMSKILIQYPMEEVIVGIIDSTTTEIIPQAETIMSSEDVREMIDLVRHVPIASHIKSYIARLVQATHPEIEGAAPMVKQYVKYGSSPRGAQAIALTSKVSAIQDGRYNVSYDDIYTNLFNSIRHRIILSFEGEAEGIEADMILEEIYQKIPRD